MFLAFAEDGPEGKPGLVSFGPPDQLARVWTEANRSFCVLPPGAGGFKLRGTLDELANLAPPYQSIPFSLYASPSDGEYTLRIAAQSTDSLIPFGPKEAPSRSASIKFKRHPEKTVRPNTSFTGKERFSDLLKLARNGDASAQALMGWKYYYGEQVPKDDLEAEKWYSEAASQGNRDAQFNLGVMNDNGEGIPVNRVKAVYWYQKAAESGHTSAQLALGWVYAEGIAAPEDEVLAWKWFSLADQGGNTNSTSMTDILGFLMTDGEVREAKQMADQFIAHSGSKQDQPK